jgi:hypothetical protein
VTRVESTRRQPAGRREADGHVPGPCDTQVSLATREALAPPASSSALVQG